MILLTFAMVEASSIRDYNNKQIYDGISQGLLSKYGPRSADYVDCAVEHFKDINFADKYNLNFVYDQVQIMKDIEPYIPTIDKLCIRIMTKTKVNTVMKTLQTLFLIIVFLFVLYYYYIKKRTMQLV